MKPFVVFRAPESVRWLYRPHGKKRYRLNAWVKMPITGETLTQDIRTKEPTTIADLMPLINQTVDELMDQLRDQLFTHWATFLLSITDETTDDDIDKFHDEFPESDYGFECYVWG